MARKTALWLAALWLGCVSIPGRSDTKPRTLPKFQIKLVDGTVMKSKDLQGKIVVIDFWGTWCKPCLAEIPDYNAFYRDYKDRGVVLLGLAAESGSSHDVLEAARRLKIDYPVAAPSWEQLDSFGEITIFPTTLVAGQSGKVEKEFVGASSNKHKVLREVVDKLLAGN
jgi:peroxiredoxin